MSSGPIAIAIHGGCGALAPELQSDAAWAEARQHLTDALRAGWAHLAAGRSSLDAVEAAIIVLEDSAHFNAGHGAALNADGFHELDASIMEGCDLKAGAVAGTTTIRNPIRAARAVMERSPSVLMAGPAADAFAAAQGLAKVPNSYFTTQRRVDALASLKARAAAGTIAAASEAEKHGTVGAVALDRAGTLAAGTSTGGFNNKPTGRIGDSPLIGAGTYALNGAAAISATGQGEVFIRHAVAHDIVARMKYGGADLQTAAETVIYKTLSRHKVGAAVIALDAGGRVVAPYNTLGMYRGWITADGAVTVATHQPLHAMGAA